MAEESVFTNLAGRISEEMRVEIGKRVVEDFEIDEGSRSDWEKDRVLARKLMGMRADTKDYPWKDCSNIMTPMISMASVQFHARALPEILPSKGIVKCAAMHNNQTSQDVAKRTSKYMNYQLMYTMEEFKASMDAALLMLPMDGAVIRKTVYNPLKKRPVSDYLNPTDFVINNSERYIPDAERKSQKLRKTIREIKELADIKYYVNTEEIQNSPGVPRRNEVEQQTDKNVGINDTTTSNDKASPRELIEQFRYWNLGKESGNLMVPIIATVDHERQLLVRLILGTNPKTKKKIECFTNYVFIPNPGSFYSLGFGVLLKDINMATNSILNQLIDSGSLQNLQTGFINKRLGMKRGLVELAMGKFPEIDLNTDDIRKAVMPMQFHPPSSVLFSLLGTLQTIVDRFTTVSEFQTGELPRSDTPANAISALVEQGMKVFTAIHKRTHNSFQQELKLLFELNDSFLDFEDYYAVCKPDVLPDTLPEEDFMAIMRQDFDSTKVRVMPVSDPNIISPTERITKAQIAYQTTLSNPLTAQNVMAVYAATRHYYEAMELPDDLIQQILPKPQPAPPPPPTPPQGPGPGAMPGAGPSPGAPPGVPMPPMTGGAPPAAVTPPPGQFLGHMV